MIYLMKKVTLYSTLFLLITSLSSCELVEGIFKAGFWSAIILIIVVVAIIIFIARKAGGK